MSYESLVDISWKFYDIALATAEISGWGAIIIGGIGFLMSKRNPKKHRRYQGLVLGGAAALACVLLAGNIYKAITFVMIDQTANIDHQQALYPQFFLDRFDDNTMEIVSLAGVLSQVASVIGMAAVTFGTGLWGISKRRSIYQRKSMRVIYSGLALMVMSVTERLLAATVYIFATLYT